MSCKRIISLMAVVMLISGCGENASKQVDHATDIIPAESQASPGDAPDDNESEPDTSANQSTQSDATTEEKSADTALSNDELSEFTKLFSTPRYNGFLITPFNNPEEINWDTVLDSGAGINVKEVDSSEIEDYLAAEKQKKLYTDLIVIRKDDLVRFVKDHTGTDFDPKHSLFSWKYVDKNDSYYYEQWTPKEKHFKCISGEKINDRYTLRFQLDSDQHFGENADRVLVLTKDNDNLIMESNSIQWEDSCDEMQTFDAQLPVEGSPVRFITYPGGTDDKATMIIVQDGKRKATLSNYIYRGNDSSNIKKVNAVGFFDFNADGLKDIAVIGESDFGECILLEESISPDFYYESNSYVAEFVEKELGSDYSIKKIKAVLLGDNKDSVFNSYQEAYSQIAKLFNMSGENYTYGLIDADGDDIPELVIDNPGYYTSLFTYENGHAHCLMNGWAYGAGGNTGYTYAKGKGVYFNLNAICQGSCQ